MGDTFFTIFPSLRWVAIEDSQGVRITFELAIAKEIKQEILSKQ